MPCRSPGSTEIAPYNKFIFIEILLECSSRKRKGTEKGFSGLTSPADAKHAAAYVTDLISVYPFRNERVYLGEIDIKIDISFKGYVGSAACTPL